MEKAPAASAPPAEDDKLIEIQHAEPVEAAWSLRRPRTRRNLFAAVGAAAIAGLIVGVVLLVLPKHGGLVPRGELALVDPAVELMIVEARSMSRGSGKRAGGDWAPEAPRGRRVRAQRHRVGVERHGRGLRARRLKCQTERDELLCREFI